MIHYSEQPDTLHLPGEGIPRDLKVVNLPQYYKENFFSGDSLYHEELAGGRYGVAGDPVPYTISNDDLLTSLLILCFLLMAFAFSRATGFVVRQAKYFFYPPKNEHAAVHETGNELRMQIVFILIACFTYALLYYSYTTTFVADTFILSSEYALIGIFMAVFLAYAALKFLLYSFVNAIFFETADCKKFLTSYLFVTSMQGVLMFPVVLLLSYFNFAPQSAVYYCVGVLFLTKLLTFYKSYAIFFRQKRFFLQIILYFCTLEIVPLLALWGALADIVSQLKVIL